MTDCVNLKRTFGDVYRFSSDAAGKNDAYSERQRSQSTQGDTLDGPTPEDALEDPESPVDC